jgi:alpha-L-rhamnosidase
MEKVLDDATLTQCTLYFRFYLHRALKQAGLGDRYGAQLKPWRDMLAIGLTTFAETPEPTRSDCHAWSASPNYDFLELICGVQPASPGFKTVRIEPALGQLQWAAARVPHPAGTIEVRLERRGSDGISADITLPPGLTGEFVWHGVSSPLQAGKQHIER